MTLLVALAAVSDLSYVVGVQTGRLDPRGTPALGLWGAALVFLVAGLYAA